MSEPLAIVLFNGRREREAIVAALAAAGAAVEAFATVDHALPALVRRPAAAIVMDSRVYPGFGCEDPVVRDLTAMLQKAHHSENLLRWQIGLIVLDAIRGEASVNRATPVVIRFPVLPEYHFSVGDELTREAVEQDLGSRQPVTACHGGGVEACVAAVVAALRA